MSQLPSGFHASGLHCGVGAKKSKPDLALFISDAPCRAAAVFTTNQVKAAPVLLSRDHLRKGSAQAIVANSGCANACTGPRGLKDAAQMAEETARSLGLRKDQVLVASTGVIGQFLPMAKIKTGIRDLSLNLKKNPHSPASSALRAIMTTDTVPKESAETVKIGTRSFKIWGCAKGSGMIHPNMATMLAFIFTDADVDAPFLKKALAQAVDGSFNSLSVDGDTSTNDSVFLLGNGLSGCRIRSSSEKNAFQKALAAVCLSLASQIADDGEGATRRVEVIVRGAPNDVAAKKIASTVATSPLVKTAVFGNDANWGRIMAALGRAGVALDPSKIEISFGNVTVARRGCAAPFSEAKAKRALQQKVVSITIDLRQGRGAARMLTCDFSIDYVKINADYRT